MGSKKAKVDQARESAEGEGGRHAPAEKPVSLSPLEFEDAVAALLQVKKGVAPNPHEDS